jgi:CubicO group peptidase (beta-lactamase class C family)
MSRRGESIVGLALVLVVAMALGPLAVVAAAPPTRPAPALPPAGAGPIRPEELETFLDAFVPAQLAEEHVVGAAVAVVQDGELLFAKGYGYADLESATPVVADRTVFGTGSTGKLFIWAAVMQLVERGVLDLDADINAYLDFDIPGTYPEPITLRHLLTHTAGFDNLPGIYAHHPEELTPLGDYLATHIPARVRPPGVRSAYSNYGAALAGYIVERATGMPFGEYLRRELFAPLQMEHTTFEQPLPAELAAAAATGYRYENGAFQPVGPVYIRLPATGASHATATDMAHFLIALLDHGRYGDAEIFGQVTGRQMQRRLFAHDPRVNGMAHGLVEVTLNGQRILKHNGSYPASFNSIFAMFPEQRVGLYASYSTNGSFTHGEHLLQAFANHYYPAAAAVPVPHPDAATIAARMAGTFRTSHVFRSTFPKFMALLPGNFADVELRARPDGTVIVTGLGAEPGIWVPVAPDVLRRADGRLDGSGDLVLGADEAGLLTTLYVQNNPYRAYERVPWHETGPFGAGVLGACLLVFLSVVAGWPLAARVGRRRPVAATKLLAPRSARWLAGGAAWLYLLALPGFLAGAFEAINFGVTPLFGAALALPLVGSGLLVGSAAVALRWWPRLGWGRVMRAHYALLLLAGAGYIWLLNTWNLLGYRV